LRPRNRKVGKALGIQDSSSTCEDVTKGKKRPSLEFLPECEYKENEKAQDRNSEGIQKRKWASRMGAKQWKLNGGGKKYPFWLGGGQTTHDGG